MQVVWTDNALFDLKNIRDFIGSENPFAAIQVVEAIFDCVENLTELPSLGIAWEENTRKLIVGKYPYLVIYRVGRVIEIVRVFHASQNWEDLI